MRYTISRLLYFTVHTFSPLGPSQADSVGVAVELGPTLNLIFPPEPVAPVYPASPAAPAVEKQQSLRHV